MSEHIWGSISIETLVSQHTKFICNSLWITGPVQPVDHEIGHASMTWKSKDKTS